MEINPSLSSLNTDSPSSTMTKRRKLQDIQNRFETPQQVAQDIDGVVNHIRGWSKRYKRKRSVVVDSSFKLDEVKSPVIRRAEEILSDIDDGSPSFLKTLVRSNCKFGSWMHLPMQFCKMHMPKRDTTFILEGVNDQEFKAHYIADRTAISAGWKAFSSAHELNEGDVLVFHLVEPSKFKIFVVKADHSASDDKGSDFNQFDSDFAEEDTKLRKTTKNLDLVPLQENGEGDNLMLLDSRNRSHSVDRSNNEFEVDDINYFSIVVNGVNVDAELSDHQRKTYFELCRSQKSYLHENLLSSINHELATGIIAQTVNISESIRSGDVFTSQEDYIVQDKILKGFDLLGMEVGFMRIRLKRLMSLEAESKVLQRCREVELEKVEAEDEMRSVELKMLELKETVKRLDDKMKKMKGKVERHGVMFQEEANAPW